MSRIYDALTRAKVPGLSRAGMAEPAPAFERRAPRATLSNEAMGLYQALEKVVPDNGGRIISFISPRGGEGTSWVARQFAEVGSLHTDDGVLLVNADRRALGRSSRPGERPGFEDVLRNQASLADCIARNNTNAPDVAAVVSLASADAEVLRCLSDRDLWNKLRKAFRLVVIDNAGLGGSKDGLAVSALADATILVIAAEETRTGVARKAASDLRQSGAKVVGFVLNKRRYYIPETIYRRL